MWRRHLTVFIFTGRNEVLAKLIFLHLSVIHSVHSRTPSRDQTPQDQTPPWTRPPWGHTPLDQTPYPRDQTPPRTRPPLGTRHPPGTIPTQDQTPPPGTADSGIRSTIGRYASYWNAFLSGYAFDKTHESRKMASLSYEFSVFLRFSKIPYCLDLDLFHRRF